uniref:(northern house mosquito) hypothetical protein n=1 Tax=Culex pipiens TaxID=7175 RepID=A0A8D8BM03_CULPI
MLETKCENSCQVQCSRAKPYCCWKQVEINCIASGFGHLGPASRVVQRFLALWPFIIVLYFYFIIVTFISTAPGVFPSSLHSLGKSLPHLSFTHSKKKTSSLIHPLNSSLAQNLIDILKNCMSLIACSKSVQPNSDNLHSINGLVYFSQRLFLQAR